MPRIVTHIRPYVFDDKDERGYVQCKICNESHYTAKLAGHLRGSHNISMKEYHLQFISNDILCLCGCNSEVEWSEHYRRFYDYVHGHNVKGKKNPKFSAYLIESHKSGNRRCSFMGKDDEQQKEILAKKSKTMQKKVEDGTFIPPHMHCTPEKRSKSQQKAAITRAKRGKSPKQYHYIRGNYVSSKSNKTFHYQSRCELKRMKFLDENSEVIVWERCWDYIPYFDSVKNKERMYNPDFIITYKNKVIIEELKQEITQNVIDKAFAASRYYRDKNLTYCITFDDKKTYNVFEVNL